ncbi:MAG: hypothetical protein QXP84_01510 [Candidatus Korarchaeum sp.]
MSLWLPDLYNIYRPSPFHYPLFLLITAVAWLFKEQCPPLRKWRLLSIATIIFVASVNTALLIIAGVRVLPGPLVGSLFLAPGAMSLEGEYLRLTKRSKWGARVEVPFIILSYFIVIQSPLTYFLVAGLPLREEIPLILSEPLYLLTFLIAHMMLLPFIYYAIVVWRTTQRTARGSPMLSLGDML